MECIEATARLEDGVAVISSGPYLNQLRGEMIEKTCRELLAGGVNRLVIDFAETDLVNSIGISILLGVIEAVNEARGYLVVSSLSRSNRELFDLLGLLQHIRVEPDPTTAIQSVRA